MGTTSLLAIVLLIAPQSGLAEVCGDVNANGSVTSADALNVLRFAVGQEVELVCTGECSAIEPRVSELETELESTQATLAAVEETLATATAALAGMEAILAGVTRSQNTIVMSGVNLQVVDGTGATAGPTNGLGNVIVGYNERDASQARTGSHNLVVGEQHAYSSFGGIVAGERNTISARAACVVGGQQNVASGIYSSVSGGSESVAGGPYSSVGAGYRNAASGTNSSVSGGCENTASNTFAAVSGGRLALASGEWASVTGGFTNKATATYSAVSGGSTRTAAAMFNWKAGTLSEAQ